MVTARAGGVGRLPSFVAIVHTFPRTRGPRFGYQQRRYRNCGDLIGYLGADVSSQALIVLHRGLVALLGDTLHNAIGALAAMPREWCLGAVGDPRREGVPRDLVGPRLWST